MNWINCPDCVEVDGAIVVCDTHKTPTTTSQRTRTFNAIVTYLQTAFPEDSSQAFADEFVAEMDELLDSMRGTK